MLDALSWAVWPIAVPLAAAVVIFFLPARLAPLLSLVAAGLTSASALGLMWQVVQQGPLRYDVGGWGASLGIELYADGLTLVMLAMTTIVGLATSVYATGYFAAGDQTKSGDASDHSHDAMGFWPLWLFLWAALNALFLSADLFNLYVTLELLGLASVALVALSATALALTAALRYLFVALLGSLTYLLGVALLYGAYGTLDVASLSSVVMAEPVSWAALALMTVGLLLKTALFPLHFWLPQAHANAPAPVSAVLSALVVKASFYLIVRLWFDVFPAILAPAIGHLLGVLGIAAILWGSVQALRQERLKLLVAYSTVAQLGYLFLMFPLLTTATGDTNAWAGGIYFALAHACAKAAMFLAAGSIMQAIGHDRIPHLQGISEHLPLTIVAFAIAGVSLMGLPPSGGFVAKWLLLTAALKHGHWWIAGVLLIGGLMAAGYVFRVVKLALAAAPASHLVANVPRRMQWAALTLALVALGLGISATQPLSLLQTGNSISPVALMEVTP
ncbi:MAG: oxidoreductase [Candidatus Entotheonella factor]|uniref:Oxidoreductase n=1 Tax=Entotheonella factor TaxID=1429438 RepID=W4LJ29_ENTF1|nr:proton-conducting transporter membrane subunit [Candidatus Entotheonella palauensis]ETW97987.1 MAG: oxidoreductase [Candidatus Entotheonella factor]